MQGTHLGDLMGMPPTGRRIDIAGLGTYRFQAGRIVEMHGMAGVGDVDERGVRDGDGHPAQVLEGR